MITLSGPLFADGYGGSHYAQKSDRSGDSVQPEPVGQADGIPEGRTLGDR